MTRAAACDSLAAAEGCHRCTAMRALGTPSSLQSRRYHLGVNVSMYCSYGKTASICFCVTASI